jgi:RimJ/RimL family protein N-acetyltransferase
MSSRHVRILDTERLRLRELLESDAAFVLRLLNEPSFIRSIGDRGVRTLADAERYLRDGAIASYRTHGYGLYLVELKESGEPLGICGLVRRDYLEAADVGFAFLPEFWSRGYASESATAVMAYAFKSLGLPRILAIVSPGNVGSIRVLEKLGLVFQGMIKPPGEGSDVQLFASET